MKKKAGLSYFEDGGSTWDWSGYDYSDPFYSSGYNDYGYGSGYETPYYGNNYGYDYGTSYDYDTGSTYSYDPIYDNSSFYDYYQPTYDPDTLAPNPDYNNAYQAGYYDNTYNYSPYTGSWDTYGNYVPDYSYTGPVAPNYNVPEIPTYDPTLYDLSQNIPTLGYDVPVGYASDSGSYSPGLSYATPSASTTTSTAGATTPTTAKPTTPNKPDTSIPSELEYPSSNPFDSGVTKGRAINPIQFLSTQAAEGGSIGNPQFMSQGGLQNLYVGGQGDGTSDEVPAMLSNGEFVIPADIVAALGNGSNEAGAGVLDNFLKTVRADKQSPDGELPPDAKSPLEYIQQAKEMERT